MLFHDGAYYLFASHLTGLSPNPARMLRCKASMLSDCCGGPGKSHATHCWRVRWGSILLLFGTGARDARDFPKRRSAVLPSGTAVGGVSKFEDLGNPAVGPGPAGCHPECGSINTTFNSQSTFGKSSTRMHHLWRLDRF